METTMRLTSPAFEDEGDIPARYTCDGEGVSPALAIEELPPETVSLVLTVEDPDAPAGTWDHWVAYDIEPRTDIPEAVEALGVPGDNSWGRSGYGPPCPPSGIHRYVFTVYALDATLDWDPGADKESVVGAIHDHVIEEATLLGFYERT
jgi:Raf kinase inhibitor-like YbhB/YbcL family protein